MRHEEHLVLDLGVEEGPYVLPQLLAEESLEVSVDYFVLLVSQHRSTCRVQIYQSPIVQ